MPGVLFCHKGHAAAGAWGVVLSLGVLPPVSVSQNAPMNIAEPLSAEVGRVYNDRTGGDRR
ncbi:hypothetical protein GCM10027079_17410 [Sediminivirga luteola]|uniref:Uncharacterized protein n=1 Tax=Sediminivirga luteola TaxID=1774748 RepID=A0A8J2TVV1_9MICO|nr:hypothetical protein GCM10011333_04880 [Sediminivirga luteola]